MFPVGELSENELSVIDAASTGRSKVANTPASSRTAVASFAGDRDVKTSTLPASNDSPASVPASSRPASALTPESSGAPASTSSVGMGSGSGLGQARSSAQPSSSAQWRGDGERTAPT